MNSSHLFQWFCINGVTTHTTFGTSSKYNRGVLDSDLCKLKNKRWFIFLLCQWFITRNSSVFIEAYAAMLYVIYSCPSYYETGTRQELQDRWCTICWTLRNTICTMCCWAGMVNFDADALTSTPSATAALSRRLALTNVRTNLHIEWMPNKCAGSA